ncbi:alpha-humulene synthase [Cryptomeria japonica]|uniref:alpha-humulene synthase n=1 Tax=Cryptomeria japonica TaxID=3369 RepID=UPI0027DAA323|nr:alpha-humulene synthase [Cryptomeria japonica]
MSNLKGDNISSVSPMETPSKFSNLWDDEFVQSMQTSYAESEYRERVETLVKQVKILLKEMQTGFDGDLIERLDIVDALQCLGIDRYFQDEIKLALDYVYGCWDGSVGVGLGCKSTTKDLNATALGLRVLRLYRYDVSAGTLKNFKDKNGQFISYGGNNDSNQINIREECMMRSMINLLRASSLAFPGETVMEDAKVFSSAYLKQLLEKSEDIKHKSYLKEAEYVLLYEWPSTVSRWEARIYIEIYELDNSRLKDKIILELTKLDFNILQYIYKMEMKKLSSWWQNSGVSKLIAIRERTIEYYLLAVSVVDNAEFGNTRITFAKASTLVSLLDDLFDDHLTLEQVELVVKAIVQGWDISIVQNIPSNFKKIVEFVFKTLQELTSEATQIQGRDMMQFIAKAWADYAEASFKQAQWKEVQCVPTYNEYINIGATTGASGVLSLHPILLAFPNLEDDAIEKIFLNKSRFYELIWLTARLVDDIHDFQDEKLHGQTASAISCYMKDHPQYSEEEALFHINNLFDQLLKELTWEFLNPNKVPVEWDKLYVNLSRGFQSFYIFEDGFSYHDKGVKQRVLKVLFDLVKI